MSSPSTPEHAPPSLATSQHPLTQVRRVHTLPTKLFDPTKTPPQVHHDSTDAIDVLLNLSFAKVVQFETAAPNSRPSSSAGGSPTKANDDDGTIPWATPSERTLAAGKWLVF